VNEVCGTGFIDGCRSQMPDDLSCCPGDDAKYVASPRGGGNYEKGGSCIPKNIMKNKMQLAKEVYDMCTQDEANKASCDAHRTGKCAWHKVYNGGNWVYNTDTDGTDACDCSTTHGGMKQCSQSDGNCKTCMDQVPYGGDGKKVSDGSVGCDGADSTYDKYCVPWYMISHCLDLAENGVVGTGFTGDTLSKIQTDITEDECDASQDFYAYKLYKAEPKKWAYWLENDEKFPVEEIAVPTTSTSRRVAVATFTVWLICVQQ